MSENEFSRRNFLTILGESSLAVLLAGCSTTTSSDQDSENIKLEKLRAEKKYKEKNIEIGDNYYSPKETTIDAGTIIIWKHIGRSLHDVVWDDAEEGSISSVAENANLMKDFTSETLRSGNLHVALFDIPGKYFYHCHFHGGPQRGHWGSITVDSTDRTP